MEITLISGAERIGICNWAMDWHVARVGFIYVWLTRYWHGRDRECGGFGVWRMAKSNSSVNGKQCIICARWLNIG